MTNDGLVYAITAIINFKISDIYKALIDIANLDDYMKSVGTMIIHEKVTLAVEDEKESDLIPNLKDVNERIKGEILKRQEEWGVDVIDFAIVSFAPTPQAQQVLSISARVRVSLKSLTDFFGDKDSALAHPQVTAALIGTPVSTAIS